jgi:hypothetical protein
MLFKHKYQIFGTTFWKVVLLTHEHYDYGRGRFCRTELARTSGT